MTVTLIPLDKRGRDRAQATVAAQHYLHTPVDPRCSVEGYAVHVAGVYGDSFADPEAVGYLLVGRPEATACYPWYGTVADVANGRATYTRWQVLNLARVWLHPMLQAGGAACDPQYVPGFQDRRGVWHSCLASLVLRRLVTCVGYEYLLARPPCFLDEPYECAYLLSYCDTSKHKGTIYRAAGFELYRTNPRGIQTWRIPLPPLTAAQDAAVREAARVNARSRRYRAGRAVQQLALEF